MRRWVVEFTDEGQTPAPGAGREKPKCTFLIF